MRINTTPMFQTFRRAHNLFVRLILTWSLWFGCAFLPPSYAQSPDQGVLKGQEALVEALTAAETDEERSNLLASNRALVTPALNAVLIPLAATFEYAGQYEQAARLMLISRQIAVLLQDKKTELFALRGLGQLYYMQDEFPRALESLDEGLRLAESLGDRSEVAVLFNSRSAVNRALGNHDQSLTDSEQALKLAVEAGDKAEAMRTQTEAGETYYLLGNYLLALNNLQASRKYYEEKNDKRRLQAVLNAIGNVYGSQGDYTQAAELYQASLKLEDEVRAGVGVTFNNIGVLQYLQGNYASAAEAFQKSLSQAEEAKDRQAVALSLNNLGITHLARRDPVKALDYSRRSLAIAERIGDKERVSEALNNIARALQESGSNRQALEAAGRAVAVAKQTKIPERVWEAYTTVGKVSASLKRYEPARQALEKAIEAVEGAREQVAGGERARQLYLEGKIAPYNAMTELLIGENKLVEALGYAERTKARVLLDVLQNDRTRVTKSMTGRELELERSLESEVRKLNSLSLHEEAKPQPNPRTVADLGTRLRQARLDYESFQTELYAKHPELKTWRGRFSHMTLEQAAALIPDPAYAILEYVVTDKKVYLFVLTKRLGGEGDKLDLRVYPLNITAKALAEKVRDFRTRVAERRIDYGDAGNTLYDLLIQPAVGQLAGKATLCIIPDGVLWELPFQALQDDTRFLIEEKAVFYTPSLGVLREMKGHQRAEKQGEGASAPNLLAFANPSLGDAAAQRAALNQRGKKLTPLPEAESEARQLAGLYGTRQSTVYVGGDAREERAKSEAGNFRVLHFATHGFLDDANPMYSYLVLAQGAGGQEDGILEAREIIEMDLRADLTVLSACDTALGRFGAGEGVIGLTWALFVAGSPTTLASQWAVESAGTSRLMVEFHHNWLEANRESASVPAMAAALRKAELALLSDQKFRHPYYWAGFALIGDAR